MNIRKELEKRAWIEHIIPELEHGTIANKVVQHQVIKGVNEAAPYITGDKTISNDGSTIEVKPIDPYVETIEVKTPVIVENVTNDINTGVEDAKKELVRELALSKLRKDLGI